MRFALVALLATTLLSALTLAAEAETVYMRVACATAIDVPVGAVCKETTPAMTSWLWSGPTPRNPSVNDRVVVDIGSGTFPGALGCNNAGWTTFKGSGREQSILSQDGIFALITDCDGLEFQDLTMVSRKLAPTFFVGVGIRWGGSGSATFTNVKIDADYTAWYDTSCDGTSEDGPTGEHFFFGSQLISGSLGYYADCGRTWLYGTDILVAPNDNTFIGNFPGVGQSVIGVKVSFRGDVRVFGSTIRVNLAGLTAPTAAHGVAVGPGGDNNPRGNGDFHMHGGIINVSSGGLDSDVFGIRAEKLGATVDPAMVHVLDTAFSLTTGANGNASRAAGDGVVRSSFQWEAGADIPNVGNADGPASLTGTDQYVETDCSLTTCTGGPDTHLMIYQESCETTGMGGPWFDVVTGLCRKP